jgi:hypothetical protein
MARLLSEELAPPWPQNDFLQLDGHVITIMHRYREETPTKSLGKC